MRYHLGDRFVIEGVEAYVGFISAAGNAYLIPEHDDDMFLGEKTLQGVVFTVLGPDGREKHGIRADAIAKLPENHSGAV